MKAIGGDLDPLLWAKKPRSHYAFAAVVDVADAGDSRFVQILDDLKKNGVTDGQRLLKVWDGQRWVPA